MEGCFRTLCETLNAEIYTSQRIYMPSHAVWVKRTRQVGPFGVMVLILATTRQQRDFILIF